MATSHVHLESTSAVPPLSLVPGELNWYAIHTRPRHEKSVAQQLLEKRVFTFLPLLQQIHQWTDRRSKVDVPMFSCYAFVRITQATEERLKVLMIPGILGFVGSDRHGTPIPNDQVENLQMAMRQKIPCAVHPFVSVGKRVRIRGGSLDGVEGILRGQGEDQSLIVSVELLQRSISIRVKGYDIEAI